MLEIVSSTILVLLVIYVVPFIVYGIFSAVSDLKPPEGASPRRFLLSVLVSKIGTALTFVGVFYAARTELDEQWLLYGALWWIMFVIGEIGQAIGPHYTRQEAVAGIISETVYCPLSAYIVHVVI